MLLPPQVAYLNTAAASPLPKTTYKIAVDVEEQKAKLGITFLSERDLEKDHREFQKAVAELVGGKKECVTFQTATAPGLHVFADMIAPSLRRGQNIVIPETEFVTNSYIWQVLAKRYGLELRTIPIRDNEFSTQDWEKLIDRSTAIVALSHVQFSNGYRSDLRFLSGLVHQYGAKLVVDATQSAGIVPLNVESDEIDFLVAGGYKWLVGPFGTGFSYIRSELLKEYETTYVGWFSASNWNQLFHNSFQKAEDGRKFLPTYYPKILALKSSINTLNEVGISNCYEHSIRLQDYLIEQLGDFPFEILSPMDPDSRSGIISLKIHGADSEIVRYLEGLGVYTSFRGEGLRISPHCYNTEDDIDRLISAIRSWKNAHL